MERNRGEKRYIVREANKDSLIPRQQFERNRAV